MNLHPWRSEWYRLVCCFFLIPIMYQVTGFWWLAVGLVLSVYIIFLLHRLYCLHEWLQNGMPHGQAPEAGGIFESMITLIHKYKRATESAHQRQSALTKQLHEILASIPSATIILNKDREIEYANYSALPLLGINGQRDIGIKIDNLLRQKQLAQYLSQTTSNNSGNHYQNISEQLEIQSPVSDKLTLAVQRVNYAEHRHLLLVHNITPHIEVQQSRKTFIANASHELRTPLTVVAGYLEFIHSAPELPADLLLPVEKAIEQSDKIKILINDLLALSRLEESELCPDDLSQVSLKEHLESVLKTLEASGKTQQHTILSSIDKDLIIEVKEKELDSVCYNLINNAIKYSEAGREITIKWEQQSDTQVKFSVIDQGIGIAPEHISHLTERFYRVDCGRSRRIGGTGLGLSIVKHILERHHGQLEIHSTLEKGSTFSAIFPISPLR